MTRHTTAAIKPLSGCLQKVLRLANTLRMYAASSRPVIGQAVDTCQSQACCWLPTHVTHLPISMCQCNTQCKCTLYNIIVSHGNQRILDTGMPFLYFILCCSVLNVKGAMQCQMRMPPDRDSCKCFIELLKFNGK